MGIPDEASWFKRSHLPTGTATGWRRNGCVLGLFAMVLFILVALIIGGTATLLR